MMDQLRCAVLLAALSCVTTAQARPCGTQPCGTVGRTKGTSVIPPNDEFAQRGDLFSSQFTELGVAGNGVSQVRLPFNVNFGTGLTNLVNVSENGFLTVGAAAAVTGTATGARAQAAPVSTPFQPVTSLRELGNAVIAPFYADLVQPAGVSGNGALDYGDVTVQFGKADPYPDAAGHYSRDDLANAVRITWYGLAVAAQADGKPLRAMPVELAQALITDDGQGTSTVEFRYGPLDDPGQAGDGSLAGFSLGGTVLQFGGPYGNGTPSFFEFLDGHYVGQFPAVPEAATWCDLVAGFGLLGSALRRRRRRATGRPAPAA